MESIYQLYGRLGDVDAQIQELVAQKQEITCKIAKIEERLAMRARAELVGNIVKSISEIKDPTHSLFQANDRLLPWRHNLPRKYFENTLVTIPEGFPSNWTRAYAAQYFKLVHDALERDVAVLDDPNSELD